MRTSEKQGKTTPASFVCCYLKRQQCLEYADVNSGKHQKCLCMMQMYTKKINTITFRLLLTMHLLSKKNILKYKDLSIDGMHGIQTSCLSRSHGIKMN